MVLLALVCILFSSPDEIFSRTDSVNKGLSVSQEQRARLSPAVLWTHSPARLVLLSPPAVSLTQIANLHRRFKQLSQNEDTLR